MLPTCNHCAWANGRECKYTPLPTPAHRGIPRCDRCRQKNLKVYISRLGAADPVIHLLFRSATEVCQSAITAKGTRNQNATTHRRNDIRSRLTMLPRETGPLRHTRPRRRPSLYLTCCQVRAAPQAILRQTQVRRAVMSLRASSVLNLKSANTFHPTHRFSMEKTPT